MKFINRGEPINIRQGKLSNCNWITLETNETIELPKEVGERNFLEELKTTEGQIGDIKVETKQIENEILDNYTLDDLFFKELTKINGIGAKTAKDIVVWGTKEKLIEQINLKAELPFRDDIVKKLEEKYGWA